jgi:hypothetical protein
MKAKSLLRTLVLALVHPVYETIPYCYIPSSLHFFPPLEKCVRFGATHMLEESQDVDAPVPEEEAFEMYRVRADSIGLETHGSPATPVQYSNVQ